MSTVPRYTVADLELLPETLDDTRYELIDGELHVSRQPDWRHQFTANRIARFLDTWDDQTGLGVTLPAPSVVFAVEDAAAPDVVWVSRERWSGVVGDDGKLHRAPDLAVEVLSPEGRNEEQDRTFKLRQYSRYGVREYWIVDWRDRTVQIHRREEAQLRLTATLTAEDTLTSPLLPDFTVAVRELFPAR
jgi:Uma2 family endonuclease